MGTTPGHTTSGDTTSGDTTPGSSTAGSSTPRPATPGQWRQAFRLARRELRGGLKGFRVFLACLALGVAAIAGIGSLSNAVEEGLRTDARAILGGDVDIRILHRAATDDELAWMRDRATVSQVAEMRAMAYLPETAPRAEGARDRMLVELKAVDGRYPLYGEVEIDGAVVAPSEIAARLAPRDGVPGVLVDRMILSRLGLAAGDRLTVGDADFEIRGVVTREPDRGTQVVTLGPRAMIAHDRLEAIGLIRPGSLTSFHYRIALPEGVSARAFIRAVDAAFPDAGWRVRSFAQATPGAARFIAHLTLYLTLVGLTALLVGGLGVANGVGAYLEGRTATIGTLKCLGAPAGLVFRTYLVQVLLIAAVGVAAGLIVGGLLPVLLAGVVEDVLPVRLRLGLYPVPLLLAGAFGMLTALLFSLWALGRAREIPPATLFRHAIAPEGARPRPIYIAATAGLALLLGGLAVMTAYDRSLALMFIGASAAAFLIFRGLAWLIARAARQAGSVPGGGPAGGRPREGSALVRFALANLHRPGAPTPTIVLSLGLGATILVAIALIQGNLTQQVRDQLPQDAPAYFFVDILPDQVATFDAAVKSVPGVREMTRMPMIRARISRVAGVPAAEAKVDPGVRWALRGERGLSYAADMPGDSELVAGEWWPADYEGPPLVSFDADLAAGMGLSVGDTITFNILGRDVTAEIANLRRVRWRSVGVNFTVIFAPGTLEKAPHMHIASVRADAAADDALLAAVTDRLPNVSAIHVREALQTAAGVIDNIGFAVRSTALVTIAAGLLVLAGAVAAGHRRRVYDAVVLKVLGATRGRVLRAFLIEYSVLGLATALIAAVLGTATGALVLVFGMRTDWAFLPVAVIGTALLCAAVMLLFGFVGTWRAMGRKAAPLLRND